MMVESSGPIITGERAEISSGRRADNPSIKRGAVGDSRKPSRA